jgi:hypothetical protein
MASGNKGVVITLECRIFQAVPWFGSWDMTISWSRFKHGSIKIHQDQNVVCRTSIWPRDISINYQEASHKRIDTYLRLKQQTLSICDGSATCSKDDRWEKNSQQWMVLPWLTWQITPSADSAANNNQHESMVLSEWNYIWKPTRCIYRLWHYLDEFSDEIDCGENSAVLME